MSTIADITVVITSFRRPKHLIEAFQSCINSNIQNIVISSSGLSQSPDTRSTINDIITKYPNTITVLRDEDLGCNRLWLDGVRASQTRWVLILHDDDKVLPLFGSIFGSHFDDNVGFYHWDGAGHWCLGDDRNSVLRNLSFLPTGKHSTVEILKSRNSFNPSPVCGLFRRRDLIETLEECESIKSGFELRPNMMVGNDTLIWLRAADKWESFYLHRLTLTSFGHWDGSTTWDDYTKHKGALAPIYAKAKSYFSSLKYARLDGNNWQWLNFSNVDSNTRIIHCTERHKDNDNNETKRKQIAIQSWNDLYSRNEMVSCHYWDYWRDSSIIGDNRDLPFLKDVLACGIKEANENDIILLTNDDTIIHPELPKALRKILTFQGATSARRCDYMPGYESYITNHHNELFVARNYHPGRDIYAFTIEWLKYNWSLIPDFVLGAPSWDNALSALIRYTIGYHNVEWSNENRILVNGVYKYQCRLGELPAGYVAHIYHTPTWASKENYVFSYANNHNNGLARRLMIRLYPNLSREEIRWM